MILLGFMQTHWAHIFNEVKLVTFIPFAYPKFFKIESFRVCLANSVNKPTCSLRNRKVTILKPCNELRVNQWHPPELLTDRQNCSRERRFTASLMSFHDPETMLLLSTVERRMLTITPDSNMIPRWLIHVCTLTSTALGRSSFYLNSDMKSMSQSLVQL